MIGEDKSVRGILSYKDVADLAVSLHKANQLEKLGSTSLASIVAAPTVPYRPVKDSSTLHEVATALVVSSAVSHVPIIASNKAVVGLARTSALMKYIVEQSTNNPKLLPDSDKSLSELRLGFRSVVDVMPGLPAIDAFKLMHERHISGIPVIDPEEGTLIGHLSMTDIGIAVSDPSILRKPVEKYLEMVADGARVELVPVVSVSKADSLKKAMERMVKAKLHRVYIVDNPSHEMGSGAVIGILTMEDVLRHTLYSE